jgi:hypothetical protein
MHPSPAPPSPTKVFSIFIPISTLCYKPTTNWQIRTQCVAVSTFLSGTESRCGSMPCRAIKTSAGVRAGPVCVEPFTNWTHQILRSHLCLVLYVNLHHQGVFQLTSWQATGLTIINSLQGNLLVSAGHKEIGWKSQLKYHRLHNPFRIHAQ